MANGQKWRTTAIGRIVVFIGGLRFAVPVMVLVAVALAVGTYIDSTQGAKVASRLVYGSSWFIALMALVAASLVFAVVTRYPWKRKHIGFITVHAGLVVLMIGGFWSLFGRVEGQLRLAEGTSGNAIELDAQQIDLVAIESGTIVVRAATVLHEGASTLALGGHTFKIVERWANTSEENYVADDGPEPLRAVQFVFGSAPGAPRWIGQASKSGGPAFIEGMTVRVLGEGETWAPPQQSGDGSPDYVFEFDGETHALAAVDDQAFPGWRVVSVRRYENAQVGPGGLQEAPDGSANPAIEVTIADGKGTIERHTAFMNFPDMVLSRVIDGRATSGAKLMATGGLGETLVLHSESAPMRASYVSVDGEVIELQHDGDLPWAFDVDGHGIRIEGQVTRARMTTRFVEAPPASEYRPALVVQVDGGVDQTLLWKGSVQISGAGGLMLRYGPPVVELPFIVQLRDFRKTDYPGTTMAMSYESEVDIAAANQPDRTRTISMNRPFAEAGWKVYQSGFINDDVSILSVMRDPGLPLTYLGCTVLCIGIIITFYSRGLSWGHPGVAKPFV